MFIECYHKIHKDQEVQGFLNYDSCAELEDIIIYNVSDVLEDNDIIYNGEIEFLKKIRTWQTMILCSL